MSKFYLEYKGEQHSLSEVILCVRMWQSVFSVPLLEYAKPHIYTYTIYIYCKYSNIIYDLFTFLSFLYIPKRAILFLLGIHYAKFVCHPSAKL